MQMIDRDVSLYTGISMGTSLAIEGAFLFGEHQDKPGEPAGLKFQSLWINLRTIIRNSVNGFNATQLDNIRGIDVYEAVKSDIEGIRTHVGIHNPDCAVELYLCTYEGISKAWPNVNFRKESPTLKQQLLEVIDREVISVYLEDHIEELKQFKWELSGESGCVLLTHLPTDMLSYYRFPSMALLESHTGIVKERKDWWTKLNVKKDQPVIPFHKEMLLIFGDKNMISPQPLAIRKRLLEISEKCRWHSLTTMSKVMNDIKLEHEPHLMEFVAKYR